MFFLLACVGKHTRKPSEGLYMNPQMSMHSRYKTYTNAFQSMFICCFCVRWVRLTYLAGSR